MIADGVLGVILLCMMLVWSALLIYAARRDVKTSMIKYENAQKTRRILIELAKKNGLDEGDETGGDAS